MTIKFYLYKKVRQTPKGAHLIRWVVPHTKRGLKSASYPSDNNAIVAVFGSFKSS